MARCQMQALRVFTTTKLVTSLLMKMKLPKSKPILNTYQIKAQLIALTLVLIVRNVKNQASKFLVANVNFVVTALKRHLMKLILKLTQQVTTSQV